MKIRVMGSQSECEWFAELFRELEAEAAGSATVQISTLYPNRGSNSVYRLYVDVNKAVPAPKRLPRGAV